jgi:hypothetical protein
LEHLFKFLRVAAVSRIENTSVEKDPVEIANPAPSIIGGWIGITVHCGRVHDWRQEK